jgi:hypothetical protein
MYDCVCLQHAFALTAGLSAASLGGFGTLSSVPEVDSAVSQLSAGLDQVELDVSEKLKCFGQLALDTRPNDDHAGGNGCVL